MALLPDIRPLFRPVQPAVSESGGAVTYEELLPDPRLSRYIYCYWQLKTHQPLTAPFYYRVVADGCIDIFFDTRFPAENYIMGFSTTYTEFPLEAPFDYIGIRFLPTAFPLLFQIDAQELTNRTELLQQVVPDLSGGLAQLVPAPLLLAQLVPAFDQYFLKIMANTSMDADPRLFEAIDLILKAQGTLQVESTLDTGISPRQLRRLFNFYIGSAPKMFSKVVRFQHILHAKPSVQSLKKNKLFYDAGYYDQAHFIKEFKTMYGQTPVIALR